MEFKYRAGDQQPSAPSYRHQTTSSSGYSYFNEQAIRAGYRSPAFGQANKYIGSGSGRANRYIDLSFRQANEYIGSGFGRANEYFCSWFAQVNEYLQNTNDVCGTIQMELEKEMIREQNIMAAISRQIVEAEVKRVEMFEKELALPARGGDAFDRFSYQLEGGMGFQPREFPFQQGKGRSLEERIAMSMEEKLGMGAKLETGGFEIMPFQQESVEPRIKQVMRAPLDVGNDKDKIVTIVSMYFSVSRTYKVYIDTATSKSFKAKPKIHFSGAKRKAVSPQEDSASKKIVKEEWSCVVCQVSAASERGLHDHIQGKKHMEAALRAERNGQNIGIGVFPRKPSCLL